MPKASLNIKKIEVKLCGSCPKLKGKKFIPRLNTIIGHCEILGKLIRL